MLQTLYLLFNEGYKASSGDHLMREDICPKRSALTLLLAEHPAGNQPRTHALLALMLLNAARLPARVDAEGNSFVFRSRIARAWNQAMIARGMLHLTIPPPAKNSALIICKPGSPPAIARPAITNQPIGRKSFPCTTGCCSSMTPCHRTESRSRDGKCRWARGRT